MTTPGLRVLDIGGGTGVYAAWLAADGHSVHVIDPVPAHVEAAAARGGITAEIGDARDVSCADASVDVALLLGPLYHLVEREDRVRALAEAYRVVRSGGLVIAAGISRYLSLLEVGSAGRLTDDIQASVAGVIATGRYDGHVGFVDAHFHTGDELGAELTHVGLRDVGVFGVEGPAWPALDGAGGDRFEHLADAAMRSARLVETGSAADQRQRTPARSGPQIARRRRHISEPDPPGSLTDW